MYLDVSGEHWKAPATHRKKQRDGRSERQFGGPGAHVMATTSGGNEEPLLVIEGGRTVLGSCCREIISMEGEGRENNLCPQSFGPETSETSVSRASLSEECPFPHCSPSIPGSWPRYYQ